MWTVCSFGINATTEHPKIELASSAVYFDQSWSQMAPLCVTWRDCWWQECSKGWVTEIYRKKHCTTALQQNYFRHVDNSSRKDTKVFERQLKIQLDLYIFWKKWCLLVQVTYRTWCLLIRRSSTLSEGTLSVQREMEQRPSLHIV